MSVRIPLSRVYHSERIDRRILEVVKAGNFILGPECRAFEEELARYMGRKFCVLSSSWTAGVGLLHEVQGLKEGDEVLVPSMTAFPTIEPLMHRGAVPVFCEVDETYGIDVADAARRVTGRTVGMIAVYLYGRAADVAEALEFCRERGLWLLEDCAQSLGAKYGGRRAGSWGDFSAVSFYPSKNLTVYGDGGAVFTDDEEVALGLGQLRNHGRRDKYVHEKVGYNLRFNEIQAAIGREGLLVLDRLNESRRRVARWYRRELEEVAVVEGEAGEDSLVLPPGDEGEGFEAVYHMFVVRLGSLGRREGLARWLRERGIETGVHYPIPNHLQPAMKGRGGLGDGALPRTERYCERILSLPMHPALSEDEVVEVAAEIKDYLRTAV